MIALADPVARVVVAESPGAYRRSWTIEDGGERLDEACDVLALLIYSALPDGHAEHLRYSFCLAQLPGHHGALHG